MVNAFGEGGTGFNPEINPSIRAEFAHTVYRFGHSMLTETVDRVAADGTRRDMRLLDAFLNPPALMAGRAADGPGGGRGRPGAARTPGGRKHTRAPPCGRERTVP